MTKKKADPIDMSAEAIARRLEQVRALYKLMQTLVKAGASLPKPDQAV